MSEELSLSNPLGELVSEEEWSSWLEVPMTKTFRRLLRKRLAERQADWVAGAFPKPDDNAKAVGECQVLRAMLELTAEQVNEGLSDE